jgi:hypothetical protein
MKIRKKVLVIGLVCAVVLGATIGGFAMANAADNSSSTTSNTTATAITTLMDKVAEIYQTNTGTTIDAQQLQKAFEEAGAAIKADKLDQMLQKLVDSGKITQAQADQWKAWWNSRPTQALSDAYKTWLQSRPSIPGLPGGNGKMMPFGGLHGMGRGMMRGWNK